MKKILISLLLIFMIIGSAYSVAYPGGFFRGNVDLYGHTLSNGTLTATPKAGSLINTAYGLKNTSNLILVNISANKGLDFGTGANYGALSVDTTDLINTLYGLKEDGSGVAQVNITANKGLEFGAGSALGSLQIKLDGTSLVTGASGLKVNPSGDSTAATFIGNVKIPDFFSIGAGRIVDTNYTYPSGGKMDSIVMMDSRSYNSTLTLLPAAQSQGNLTIVKLVYAPGLFYTRINVTGDEHINGKHLVYTTDDSSTFLPSITLWSSGAAWYVINAYGNWTSADN